MTHLSTPPTLALRPYVERYVLVDRHFPPGHQAPLLVAPCSTSQLAINGATANLKPDEAGALDRHYAVAVVGPFTRRHHYVLHGHIYTLVAYFTPVGLRALLGLELTGLADETVDFARLRPGDARRLTEAVRRAEGHPAKIKALEAYLLGCLPTVTPVHPDVQRATDLIRERGGNLPTSELLARLTLRQRAFERHFRQTTGLTPKQFMRITRFLAVRNAIADQTYRNWHDVLHQGGYYDQAHFIREFSLFTGQTPSAYFARDLGFDNFLLKP